MILEKLEMQNFRQFRELNCVEFSAEPKKNITIIFGENGRGKTGIYRAIMFCLYGEKRLSQDPETSRDDIHLVNTASTMENAESNIPTEAHVEIVFRHHTVRYIMRRTLKAVWTKGKQKEQESDIMLQVEDKSHDTKTITDVKEINEKINEILDKRVREFFLFDGERIETLTRASESHRNDIAKAVKQLLNIDSIKFAVDILQTIRKQLDDQIQRTAKGEYGQYLQKRNKNEQEIEANKQRIEDIEADIEQAIRRKSMSLISKCFYIIEL